MKKGIAKDLSIDLVIILMGVLAIFSFGVVTLPYVDPGFLP